jgi:hypothetical protein
MGLAEIMYQYRELEAILKGTAVASLEILHHYSHKTNEENYDKPQTALRFHVKCIAAFRLVR